MSLKQQDRGVIYLFIMNDRILELYCSLDKPQHLAGFTVSFLTLPPNLQVIGQLPKVCTFCSWVPSSRLSTTLYTSVSSVNFNTLGLLDIALSKSLINIKKELDPKPIPGELHSGSRSNAPWSIAPGQMPPIFGHPGQTPPAEILYAVNPHRPPGQMPPGQTPPHPITIVQLTFLINWISL